MLGVLDSLRIRRRLRRVAKHLAGRPVGHLTPDQRARRHEAIRELNHYRRWKRLPRNTFVPGRRPVFVDERGTHCAVAHLMAATGNGQIVSRVRECQNLSYVREMTDPDLPKWGRHHGLALDELARIQPAYSYPKGTDWAMGWMIIGFASAALVAIAVAVASRLARIKRRSVLSWIAAAITAGSAVVVTIRYEPQGEGLGCFGQGLVSCYYKAPPAFALPVMIALYVAAGLTAGLAVIAWIQGRRNRSGEALAPD